MNVHSEIKDARGPGRPALAGVRRRLLDAGLRLFAERGYHGTAVPDVARAAKVSTGMLYRHFANKEELVNEVYRDAKGRLGLALLEGLALDGEPAALFAEIWRRLVRFARAEPRAFRFLEMQDHLPYLDAESRELERAVLTPVWTSAVRFRKATSARMQPDVAIAFIWGALVGLFKAERLGYLKLGDAALASACDAAWAAIAGETPKRRR